MKFERRAVESVNPAELVRLDACWSVAMGFSTVDNLRGAYLQTRHLLLALEVGEPFRVLRALALEAGFLAIEGARAARRVDELLSTADGLARELEDPYALGFVHLARATSVFLRADFAGARQSAQAAELVFERRPMMASWELASARMFSLWTAFYRGDLAEIQRRVPELIGEAERRGDLYAATCFRVSLCNLAWLVGDDPAEARRQLTVADERWAWRGMHLQHYWSMVAWVQVDLYEGRATAAYARLARERPRLRRYLLLRIENLRIEFDWLYARAALARAQREPQSRRALLEEADGCARRLWREGPEWAKAVSLLVTSGVARLRGDGAGATTGLVECARRADDCGLTIVSFMANWCLEHSLEGAAVGPTFPEGAAARLE